LHPRATSRRQLIENADCHDPSAMNKVLDITPLRSLLAIASEGGFHRAASSLDLTQSAVSQHVRRLEAVVGAPLVERDGRRTRFTTAGETLVTEARQILEAHDRALTRFAVAQAPQLTIGVTEHASDLILPPVIATLGDLCPELKVQFRFDRTRRLNESLDQGAIDIAVFVAEASERSGVPVGTLPLRWCAAPGWQRPSDPAEPLPIVAMRVLAERHISATVVGEAAYLAGALNAARAGLGAALIAFRGAPPEGLVERLDMPEAPGIHLSVRTRPAISQEITSAVVETMRSTLSPQEPAPAEGQLLHLPRAMTA
jgi:DNA-binding transcriptional LysR family regulator